MTVLKKHLQKAVKSVPAGIARYDEIMRMLDNLNGFDDLDDKLVPEDSLLREFIGGGNFEY